MVTKVEAVKSGNILVVEDNDTLSHLIRKRLNREGFKTHASYHGRDAIKIVQQDEPNLIMLDFRLPDMNGKDIVVKLFEMGFRIPFIVMTTNDDSRMAVEMMKLGAIDYLIKEGNYLDLMMQVLQRAIKKIEADKQLAYAQKKLKESEKRYRMLFERDVAGNYHATADGRIIDCNDAFARIFGYESPTELIHGYVNILYANPVDCEMFNRDLKKQGLLQNHEARMRKRDGSPLWILQSVILFSSTNGHSDEIQGTLVDITERKRAEEELRISKELISGIVTSAPVGIMYLNRAGETIYLNPVMKSLLKFILPQISDYLNVRISDIPEFQSAGGDRIVENLLEGRSVDGEKISFRHTDTSSTILRIYGAPRRGSGNKIIGAVFIANNITELESLDLQLRHAQKMEVIGQLASTLAHDFNNQHTVISASTELSLMDIAKSDPIAKSFLKIKEATDLAKRMTSRLMNLSRKENPSTRVVDLNSHILSSKISLQPLDRGMIEILTLPGRSLWPVKVDPANLDNALINLGMNAIDAMPAGGKLIFETSNEKVTASDIPDGFKINPGSFVRLAVRDTGIGMDDETRARIFVPLFTTKDPGKGTGLGLAAVARFVESSGGFYNVESIVDEGSTFQIYLPMTSDCSEFDQGESDIDQIPNGNETILIVEDDEDILELAGRILNNHGYEVVQARSGKDALLICEGEDQSPELVVVDVIMPEMRGAEFVQELTKRWPALKALYMSGYSMETLLQKGYLSPGAPFLPKPFQMTSLALKVREVLDW